MKPLFPLFLLLCWSFGVSAQAIYKCVGKGPPVYQNVPCSPSHRVAAVRPYEPAYVDPSIEARNRRTQQQMDQRNETRSVNGGLVASASGDARGAKRAGCETAKRQRKATLDSLGLRRTYDILSRLDAMVAKACQGL